MQKVLSKYRQGAKGTVEVARQQQYGRGVTVTSIYYLHILSVKKMSENITLTHTREFAKLNPFTMANIYPAVQYIHTCAYYVRVMYMRISVNHNSL